ncbi:uncharacterized protein BYT42DRAFT_12921 [Radiomyces spectabilis]|uniref:uncharacterized protein n=1 Tax=Radiomyces spectabilis TaxID=64574 RepID=UPI002220ABDA|nr:uncharacterized protein BYT42DRAFT_12921 [Radiomyces spectabilis]KAI8393605.1 hypothetical protein BYT42DRAFT_12921 [Radiomyces spectabilis]
MTHCSMFVVVRGMSNDDHGHSETCSFLTKQNDTLILAPFQKRFTIDSSVTLLDPTSTSLLDTTCNMVNRFLEGDDASIITKGPLRFIEQSHSDLISYASDVLFQQYGEKTGRSVNTLHTHGRQARPVRLRTTSMIDLRTTTSLTDHRYTFKVCMVELHNDHVYDLLGDTKVIDHCLERTVSSTHDMKRFFNQGMKRRLHNSSHCIFSILYKQEVWISKPKNDGSKSTPLRRQQGSFLRANSSPSVKEIIGQMEKQARNKRKDTEGEWTVKQSHLHFILTTDSVKAVTETLCQFPTMPSMYHNLMAADERCPMLVIACISIHEADLAETVATLECFGKAVKEQDEPISDGNDTDMVRKLRLELLDYQKNQQELMDARALQSEQIAELERTVATMDGSLKEREHELREVYSQNMQWEKLWNDLLYQHEQYKQKVDQAAVSMEKEMTQEIERLKRAYDICKEKEQIYHDQLADAQENNAVLRKHMWENEQGTQISLRLRLEELERCKLDLARYRALEKSQTAMIVGLERKQAEMDTYTANLCQQLTQRDGEIDHLKKCWKEEIERKEKWQEQSQDLQRQVSSMVKERQRLEMTIRYIDHRLQHQDDRFDQLYTTYEDQQHAFRQRKKEYQEMVAILETDNARLKSEIMDFKQRLNEQEMLVDTLQKQQKVSLIDQQRTRALESRVEELDATVEQMSTDKQKAEQVHYNLVRELAKSAAFEKKIQALEQTMEEERALVRANDHTGMIEKLEDKIKALEKAKQTEQEDFEASYEIALNDLETSRHTIAAQQRIIDSLRRESHGLHGPGSLEDSSFRSMSDHLPTMPNYRVRSPDMKSPRHMLLDYGRATRYRDQDKSITSRPTSPSRSVQMSVRSLSPPPSETMSCKRREDQGDTTPKQRGSIHSVSSDSGLRSFPSLRSVSQSQPPPPGAHDRAMSPMSFAPSPPPSNPLPPIPDTMPMYPIRSSASTPIPTGTSHSVMEDGESSRTSYQRIIDQADSDIRAHQHIIGKLETQLSRSESKTRETKKQLDVLLHEKHSNDRELQMLKEHIVRLEQEAEGNRQHLESRLHQERLLKEKAEKARAILEDRLDTLMMTHKRSKFMCF